MKVAIVTLFPEIFDSFLSTSLVARAIEQGNLQVEYEPLREHGIGRYQAVDDTPYGGGAGMLLRVDCVVSAIEGAERRLGERAHRVLLTPQGVPFAQASARRLVAHPSLLFVCGRYEGFDERLRAYVDEELSLGDFVMTGGEVAVMAVLETCVRLLPGVLGNAESVSEESFSTDAVLLEYPQYTRPKEFRGAEVPEVLLSGHHAAVAKWRHQRALERTRRRRPDLAARQRGRGEPTEPGDGEA